MKSYFLLFALMFVSTFTFAQTTSASTETSTENKIRIRINGEQLRVQADGNLIDLDYSFDKDKTKDLINAFNKNLDVSGNTDFANTTYSASAAGYDINIQKGKLTMDLDKEKLSNEAGKQILNGVQDALAVFGVNIQTSLSWGEE